MTTYRFDKKMYIDLIDQYGGWVCRCGVQHTEMMCDICHMIDNEGTSNSPVDHPNLSLITSFLTNADLASLKQVNRKLNNDKKNVIYTEMIPIFRVDKKYAKNYKHVLIIDTEDFYDFLKMMSRCNDTWQLTHLTFGDEFEEVEIYEPHERNDGRLHYPLSHEEARHDPFNYDLPQCLTHIDFGDQFNQPFDDDHEFPEKLISLRFGRNYDQALPKNLPEGLQRLEYAGLFDDFDIKSYELPKKLTHLIHGFGATQGLPNLPDSILYLKCGDHFNGRLPDRLPPKLMHLDTGIVYSGRLPNLPKSLTFLKLDRHFLDIDMESSLQEISTDMLVVEIDDYAGNVAKTYKS